MYELEYRKIIDTALSENRQKYHGTYYEDHHIIPESLGGLDDSENMVLLTGQEHFRCHELLPFIYDTGPAHDTMLFAWNMMRNSVNYSAIIDSKIYEALRIEFAKLASRNLTNVWQTNRKNMIASMTGVPKSKNHRNKISKYQTNKVTYKDKTTGKTGLIDKELFDLDDNLCGATAGIDGKSKDKIGITDGKNNKFVDEKLLIWYLSDGWKLGGKPKAHPVTLCPICSKNIANPVYSRHLIRCKRIHKEIK